MSRVPVAFISRFYGPPFNALSVGRAAERGRAEAARASPDKPAPRVVSPGRVLASCRVWLLALVLSAVHQVTQGLGRLSTIWSLRAAWLDYMAVMRGGSRFYYWFRGTWRPTT